MSGTDTTGGGTSLHGKMRWDRIFAPEPVNLGRQHELDLAKAAILIYMPIVHCIIECTPEEGLVSGIPYLFDSVLGGPLGAPIFMFAMGVGMVYAHGRTPADYIRRGIRLEIAGYMLNVFRFLLPFLAGYLLTGDWERYIGMLPYRVLGDDILQFAGLAMIVMGLLTELHIPDIGLFVIALAASVLSGALNGVDVGTPLGNIFLGYLIGTEDAAGKVFSDFPLMNWLIVPVCGYIFGKRLQRVKDKKLFYGIFSSVCGLEAAIWFALGIGMERGMFGEGQNCYYHISTGDVLSSIAGAIGILGIYYLILPHLSDRMVTIAGGISYHINQIYCVHWVLVSWITMVGLYAFRGTQELPVPVTLLLGALISVVSISVVSISIVSVVTARLRRKP